MDTQPAFGSQELFTHVIADMAKAIAERNGETQLQQFIRSQAAVHTITGFRPRDVIEAMLAGHCVMFHELMVDSVHNTMRGEMDTMRRTTRSSIVAMDKAFGNNLTRLERYRLRPSEGRRDVAEVQAGEAQAEMEIVGRTPVMAEAPVRTAPKQAVPAQTPAAETQDVPVQTPAAETQDVPAQTPVAGTQDVPVQTEPAVSSVPVVPPVPDAAATVMFRPSPEAIAACRANPEAMAALDAGDPVRFARAMGIDQPSEAYLTAAAGKGSAFDRQGAADRAPDVSSGRSKA